MDRQTCSRIVDIARDPNGVYIGRDKALNIYFFHIPTRVWVEIHPEDYGEPVIQ